MYEKPPRPHRSAGVEPLFGLDQTVQRNVCSVRIFHLVPSEVGHGHEALVESLDLTHVLHVDHHGNIVVTLHSLLGVVDLASQPSQRREASLELLTEVLEPQAIRVDQTVLVGVPRTLGEEGTEVDRKVNAETIQAHRSLTHFHFDLGGGNGAVGAAPVSIPLGLTEHGGLGGQDGVTIFTNKSHG